MKTPKDKAKELVEKYYAVTPTEISLKEERVLAIECAKIAVDEIISKLNEVFHYEDMEYEREKIELIRDLENYYLEVKNELNKM